jgi:hypothetical protein
MTPVPQAAVDAAKSAVLVHQRDLSRCRCGWQPSSPYVLHSKWREHQAEAVAAAVVAAAQGPIKAEALREAADEFEEFAFVDDKRFKTVNTAAVRLNAARILRASADRIEAQPPADAHTPEERILRDILTNQPE